ncbi:MAG: DNA repair protein RecO [Clostridia bacterium]|nr:DNA repair protein RecO [Clostridia bacterium]
MAFATDGLITRVTDVGVSDKLVNIITPDRGRIGVFVKGGRSPNSKLTPVSQLFTYANFEIYEKNSAYVMRGGLIIRPFYELSIDIEKIAVATYLCDLANELTDEDVGCEALLKLLLNSLHLICKGEKDIAAIKSVFELRAAAMSGYLPELSGCTYCGAQESEMTYLDVMGGRLICSDCLSKHNARPRVISKEFDDIPEASVLCGLSPAALAALRFIICSPPGKAFSFELKDPEDLRVLSRATESYILNHLGRGFDSLDFYKAVKEK